MTAEHVLLTPTEPPVVLEGRLPLLRAPSACVPLAPPSLPTHQPLFPFQT